MKSRWLWLLLILPMIVGLARLRFDVEILNLLPDEVEAVRGLKLYQQNFSNARELILTLRGKDADSTETAARAIAETLRQQPSLTAAVTWQPPWLEHPGQAAELMAYLWLNQRPEVFAELTNRLAPGNLSTTLASAREELATSMSPQDIARLSYDPFGFTRLPESATGAAPAMMGQGQEMFASADGRFRIIFVQARSELASYPECARWLRDAKAVIEKANPNGVIIHYTGRPAFVAEIAGGMERDMTESILLTAVIIAILFWIAHRRWRPMLWLLTLLGLILVGTLALGGLFFGTINVVSLGFAAILLGLAVDYGVVHYQEAMASPESIIPEIRRAIGPSIFWAAVTTICAFLVLNFGGLPGLAQLGSLVAVGVTLSALVMLFAFLPPLFRDRIARRRELVKAGGEWAVHPPAVAGAAGTRANRGSLAATLLLVVIAAVTLANGLPKLDRTANALRPRNSPAYAALDEIKSQMTRDREPLWVMAQGRDASDLARRLDRAEQLLQRAAADKLIGGFTLPTSLWPRPEHQQQNQNAAAGLIAQRDALRAAALAGGFSTNAFGLADAVLNTWQSAATAKVFWPTNEMSRWIFDKLMVRRPQELLVIGLVYPPPGTMVTPASVAAWAPELGREGFILSGWELLGGAILQRVQGNLWRLVVPMVALVMLSLWLAFRRSKEIVLSIAVLGLSGLCLLAIMRVGGWSWNLLNLMALPLVLGTGVDYSIFMQLALRRHNGDAAAAHLSVGRALLLCGGTAVAGFGSLGLSSNAGMASLGQICAVGVGCNMLISIYLLPAWWRSLPSGNLAMERSSQAAKPSSLYQAKFWLWGLSVARVLPAGVAYAMGRLGGWLYWLICYDRRMVVTRNLLPVLNRDLQTADEKTRQLFDHFGRKLVDLWRYEAGLPMNDTFGELTGWEHFQKAKAAGRGILLVTPHLGNWEFGAPLLGGKGEKILVLTQAEPSDGLTEMRKKSRARWGIETLVVGDDPFAFVEIIKRLEAGATVALLVDRPPAPTATTVELFGRPFAASVAAAELARASGCCILPVYLPHTGTNYAAHILPEISYDRRALGDREARQAMTQEIMRAFEPAIKEYADQWYHFVPL